MRPLHSTLCNWRQKMLILQQLALLASTRKKDKPTLRETIITKAMRNPLLRTITINGATHIAHATPDPKKHIFIRGNDNPLENAHDSIGKHRVKMDEGEKKLILELNVGLRDRGPIGRELDQAIEQLGRESVGPFGLNLEAAEQHSHLLCMTMPSRGSAFEWKPTTQKDIAEFTRIQIVQRKEEKLHSMPTFDLLLYS